MTILSQIREEAANIANGMALEIIELAQADLTRSRFKRLRKGKTLPINQQELEYIHALKEYVDFKLKVRHLNLIHHKLDLPPRYWKYKKKKKNGETKWTELNSSTL